LKIFYKERIRERRPLIIVRIPTVWKKSKKMFLEISNKLKPASKSIIPISIVGSKPKLREDINVQNPLKRQKRAK
jgi:hypothetical protein